MIDNRNMRRYIAYAIGEIVLVVLGILIALQIDNANQNKLERNALNGYLNSIARNIESDLTRAQSINEKRRDILPRLSYMQLNIYPRVLEFSGWAPNNYYTKEDVSFCSETISMISELDYLNPNTSGFESLKNSGYLPKLQDSDVESLISQYYNILNQITREEENYNQGIQSANSDFLASGIEGIMEFYNTDWTAWTPEALKFMRPRVVQIMTHPAMQRMTYVPFNLIVDYENLMLIGNELVRMIEEGSRDLDEAAIHNLDNVYNSYGDIGYPNVLIDGSVGTGGFHSSAAASSMNNIQFYRQEKGYVEVNFPSTAWGAFYYYNGSTSVEQFNIKDYSVYQTLRLELKGDKGGEQVQIGLKDESNPTDGSETKVTLTLSDEWEVYDIPLSQFAPTDLSRLFMVASFVFEREATSMSVKTIQYLR